MNIKSFKKQGNTLYSFKSLNPTNSGQYYMIDCPVCGHHEAYVYKDEVIKAQKTGKPVHYHCNRQSKCGASGLLSLDSGSIAKFEVKIDKSTGISEAGLKRLQSLYDINYLVKGFDFELRGISNDILKENKVMYFPWGFQTYLYEADAGQSDEKYFKKSIYKDRDLMFPITDKNGKLQRILLRKTGKPLKRNIKVNGTIRTIYIPVKKHKNSKKERKEVQVRLIPDPVTEIFNLKDVYRPETRFVFLCEGAFDALSIKEACKYINMPEAVASLGIPGTKKTAKSIAELSHISGIKQKRVILAFDNDEAGKEAIESGINECKKHNIPVSVFNPAPFNDLNEWLQKDKDGFVKAFKKKIVAEEIKEARERANNTRKEIL